MRNRDNGLNAVFFAFGKYRVVKFKSFFIWRLIITIWKNTCPSNRHSECFKAHFRKESDIFLIVMIKIDATPFRIQLIRFIINGFSNAFFGNDVHFGKIRSAGSFLNDFCSRQAFAADVPSSFELVCGSCASPQEIFWKAVRNFFSIHF